MPNHHRSCLAIAALSVSLLLSPPSHAQDITLHMATVEAGSQPADFMTTFAEIASAHVEGVQIDVFPDGTDTMDTMFLGRGVLDMSMISPVTHALMIAGTEMFADESVAPQLSAAVQLVLWFPQGRFHFAVRADSEIMTLNDVAGTRVLLGPHALSAAHFDAASWIEATTGLVANQDYEAVSGTWNAGAEALLSGEVDVFISACLDPCLQLEELSSEANFRFIGPETASVDAFFQAGRSAVDVRSEMRQGERTGSPVATFETVAGIGVYDDTDEQVVYDIVRAFWENLSQMPAGPSLANLSYATAQHGSISFHPGAERHFREIGAIN